MPLPRFSLPAISRLAFLRSLRNSCSALPDGYHPLPCSQPRSQPPARLHLLAGQPQPEARAQLRLDVQLVALVELPAGGGGGMGERQGWRQLWQAGCGGLCRRPWARARARQPCTSLLLHSPGGPLCCLLRPACLPARRSNLVLPHSSTLSRTTKGPESLAATSSGPSVPSHLDATASPAAPAHWTKCSKRTASKSRPPRSRSQALESTCSWPFFSATTHTWRRARRAAG